MSKRKRFQEKGSALLVVLGFLSFMIISAVSFSIYMRVERQASSSYRHAVVGRHLLESALYRAIDEIDAELQSGGDDPASAKKFPNHWKAGGRVYTSVSNSAEVERARVLSLDVLGFLPATLVNDVRVSSLESQWRRMSIKFAGVDDPRDVGRYAYACVNLSDMLNVNGCTNVVRGLSNLVTVASLFPSGKADSFSQKACDDIYYLTLQDFYACMKDQNFFEGKSSPYMDFLANGDSEAFNYDNVYNHFLVTDGFAKVPPAQAGAINVTLFPPSDAGPFFEKVKETLAGNITDPNLKEDAAKTFVSNLQDYYSPDNVGVRSLFYPSSKLAPMICQVRLADGLTPMITAETMGTPPNEVIEYTLNFAIDPNVVAGGMGLQVRVCYPFKNLDPARIKKYTLNVEGFFRVDKTNQRPNMRSDVVFVPESDFFFSGTADIQPPTINSTEDAQTLQDKCYQWIPVNINVPAPIKMVNSKDAVLTPGFEPDKQLNVALVISSMKVKIGSAFYDSVPTARADIPELPTSKLYFQTIPAATKAGSPGTPFLMPYRWDSLETPDPRFNHFAANWVSNGRQPPENGKPSPLDPNYTSQGMHQITKDFLGKEGRDADIFMSSSAAGRLLSVGEMGFIIRPYECKEDGFKGVDFATKVDFNADRCDSDAFFRTVRLYDQGGNNTRDKIYENFYMAKDDEGNLPPKANVRVNPLSPIGAILGCAIDRVPYDYSVASGANTLPKQNYTEGVLSANWLGFAGAWAKAFSNVVISSGLNTNFTTRFHNFYGDDTMGWYSAEIQDRKSIFQGYAASVPVFEVDRKMMHAFSFDSMSDRQQLFLYVLQAEASAPLSLAKSRSMAGGRIVAVVWRDPYPKKGTTDYHEHKVLYYKQLDN
jgi:hypothetical protein